MNNCLCVCVLWSVSFILEYVIGKFSESCIIKGCQEWLSSHCWLDLISTRMCMFLLLLLVGNIPGTAWHMCTPKKDPSGEQ